MDSTKLCSLCWELPHSGPNSGAPYGLVCPGEDAPQDAQDRFRQMLGDANEVASLLAGQPFADQITCNREAVAKILGRKAHWDERLDKERSWERSGITHEQLQEDCDARAQRTYAGAIARAKLDTITFEPPENLRIPGKVPVPQKPIAMAAPNKQVTETDDAALFLGTKGVGQ